MPPLVKYRPSGAASQSKIPEWQRFLDSLPSGGGKLSGLARPEPGSPEDVLARAETAYANKQDQAAALGVEGDGSSARGLLMSSLGKLDYLRATAFSAGKEIADAVGGGGNGASVQDFVRQRDEHMGFGDTQALQVDEDDGGWEKALKLGAAFVGDVATDPLTYVTAGSATIGKKAAGEIVQSTLAASAKNLGDDVVGEFAERSLRMRGASAAQEAAEAAGDDLARETAEGLALASRTKPSTFSGTQEEWVRGLGESHFGSAAAEAYHAGGHTGLYRFLTKESGLSKKAGEELFDQLPRELKGGIRIRVPLARKDGLALTYGVGGAGRPARALLGDDVGEKIAEGFVKVHAARNAARASKAGRAVADRIGGADGDLYGQMIADLSTKTDDGIGGVTYAAYDGVRRARRAAQELGSDLHNKTLDSLGRAETFIAGAPNEQQARAAYESWFHNPAGLRELREGEGIVKGADGMWYRSDGTELTSNPSEAAGLAAAIEGHGYLNQTLQQLRDAGLTVGEIRDYVPRIMSEDEKYLRALKKPAKGSQQGQTGSVAGTNPTKARERHIEATVVEGPDGPQLEFRWLTAQEIRQAEGRAIFETDPNLIVAGYGDAARKLATRQRFASVLHEAGVLAPGGTSWQKIVNDRAVRDAGNTVNKAGRRYSSHLERMRTEAAEDVADAEASLARAEARAQAATVRAAAGADEADELRAAADDTIVPLDALPPDSPLNRPRQQYVDDEAARQVEQTQARLAVAAEKRRLAEAKARHAEAMAEFDAGDAGAALVEGAVLDGRGAPLFRALFVEDGKVGFGLTDGLEEDDAAALVGTLTELGWVHTTRRIEPGTDEHEGLAKVWGGHKKIPDSELSVEEWNPPNDLALADARRSAYQAARKIAPDDWQERTGRYLDDMARQVSQGRRQVYLDMLPEDPDDFAAVVRMVDELESATGWRLAWRGSNHPKGDDLGWYLKNYAARPEGGALPAAGVAARDVAAARKLRELGYDVPEPTISTSPLSTAQGKLVSRLAEALGITVDAKYRGPNKPSSYKVTGTPEELRSWADTLDEIATPPASVADDVAEAVEAPVKAAPEKKPPATGNLKTVELSPEEAQEKMARAGLDLDAPRDVKTVGPGGNLQTLDPELGWGPTPKAGTSYRESLDQLSPDDFNKGFAGMRWLELEGPDGEIVGVAGNVYRMGDDAVTITGGVRPAIRIARDEDGTLTVVGLHGRVPGKSGKLQLETLPGWKVRQPDAPTPEAPAALTPADLPPVPEGHTRIYRGDREMDFDPYVNEHGVQVDAPKGWWAKDYDGAMSFTGRNPANVFYDDVPTDELHEALAAAGAGFAGGTPRWHEVYLPGRAGGGTRMVPEPEAPAAPAAPKVELSTTEAKSAKAAAKKLRQKADEVDAAGHNDDIDPSILEFADAAPAPVRPTLDEFLGDTKAPSIAAGKQQVAKAARQGARSKWDEAFRAAAARGRILPDDVYQSSTPQVRTNVERLGREEREGILKKADELEGTATAELDDAAVARGQARAARHQAAARLADLEQEIDRVATDRDALSHAVRGILDEADPEAQYEQVDALMSGLIDFHERHAARYGKDMAAAETAARRFMLGKQEQYAAKQGRKAKTAGGQAKTGRQDVDSAGMFWQDQGLVKVAGRGGRPNPTENLSTLPPELDVTYAPEQLARTVERFYKAARPSEDVKKWLDSVYRPYFYLFKAYATVGRGPGYHVRNLVGGMWNNWMGDATAADHALSAKLVAARREASKRAITEEAERIARRAGISVKQAEGRVAPQAVSGRVDAILASELGKVKVADDVTLYDVHRLSAQQGVGLDTRVQEGIHAMTARDSASDVVRGKTRADLWSHKDTPDRNLVQRGMNRAADNPWIRTSGNVAQTTEEYLRNAMFIRGMRTYGKVDDGRSARMLVEAYHFDYQDLSDFERGLKNTLIPFYVWSRRNLPVQFSSLVKEPGKINRLLRANDAAREMFGDDEETIVPDWMQENHGWVSKLNVGGGPMAFGIESPVTDLNQFIKVPRDLSASGLSEAAGATLSQIASASSPVVKLPVELATGTDTFTGAQFNPAGAAAPWWYRALPDAVAPTRTDSQGKVRGNAALISGLQDSLPPLGVADRAIPLTPEQKERRGSNWISLLAPVVAASTLTPGQKAGELRSRTGRLDQAIEWGPLSEQPDMLETVRDLLDKGYTPEQVHEMLVQAGVLPR